MSMALPREWKKRVPVLVWTRVVFLVEIGILDGGKP